MWKVSWKSWMANADSLPHRTMHLSAYEHMWSKVAKVAKVPQHMRWHCLHRNGALLDHTLHAWLDFAFSEPFFGVRPIELPSVRHRCFCNIWNCRKCFRKSKDGNKLSTLQHQVSTHHDILMLEWQISAVLVDGATCRPTKPWWISIIIFRCNVLSLDVSCFQLYDQAAGTPTCRQNRINLTCWGTEWTCTKLQEPYVLPNFWDMFGTLRIFLILLFV